MDSFAPNANNVLGSVTREEFRAWLARSAAFESECWVEVKRGREPSEGVLPHLDAVEEAICFGWIDSVSAIIDGRRMQRFSPRKKNSPWTELNKERARRLEALGLMTDAGRRALPKMGPRSFRIDPDIEAAMKRARAWSRFRSFPPLYQRVRAYNVQFYKKRDPKQYERALAHLIDTAKRGEMFGDWNDNGRLTDYLKGDAMEDYRLQGQERFLKGLTLYRVEFPAFWKKSYEEKNPFFEKISEHAHMYVRVMHEGEEFLEGEKIQQFWHEHCEFCMEKAEALKECVFYCTKDLRRWICAECFEDFKERFGWEAKPSDELFDE